jgi:hypothetical protein
MTGRHIGLHAGGSRRLRPSTSFVIWLVATPHAQVAMAMASGAPAAQSSRRLERLANDDGGGAGASSVAAFELSYRELDETPAQVFRLLPVNTGLDVSTAAVTALADLSAGTPHRGAGRRTWSRPRPARRAGS